VRKIKVTIAIPVKNGEDHIFETLRSLKGAKISKIIVSNNFSTDKTGEIVKGFKEVTLLAPRIALNMIENWNFVTDSVDSEYIRLVSHDDLPNIDSIIDHQNILDSNPDVGMVFSRRGFILESKRKQIILNPGRFRKKVFENPVELLKEICRRGTNPCGETFAVTIRRSLFQPSSSAISWYEREPFELCTYMQLVRSAKIFESPHPGGYFRVHLKSHSGGVQNYFSQAKQLVEWVQLQPEFIQIPFKYRIFLKISTKFRAILRMLIFRLIASY
jgi:glycosyltransferase involved in cell wall biosynthesis